MALEINEYDPCGAASQLRQVYINLLAGASVAEISFRAGPNGVERRVSYAKADADGLLKVIRDYEQQCDRMLGRGPRRFGLVNGGRF